MSQRYLDDEERGMRKDQRASENVARTDDFMVSTGVKNCLATREGRKFLWWLLEIGEVNKQPYRGNALDTSFNCGSLNVGLMIQARIIEVDSAGYVRMMKENEDEQRERRKPDTNTGTNSNSGADSDA